MPSTIRLVDGKVGDTWQDTTTDTVQNLDDDSFLVMQDSNGKNIMTLWITINNNDMRWAIGADPSQAGAGHLMEKDGVPFSLRGTNTIRNFRYISAINGATATIIYTPFYNY